MKILLAEDDPIATAVIDAALRKLGHEVQQASDGPSAWALFANSQARLVVSDWVMPGFDGLEFCRRIRERGGDYTYFILLSNLSTSGGNLERAVAGGVDDFLNKPVNVDELRLRLHVAERILNYATQVRQLESFIPICTYCKKVRNDKNYWDQIETYINAHTGSQFSHGVCPECYDRVLVPQMRAAGITPPPLPGAVRAK
jgi:sigma-B regulation protein RsbU (phosphoserine phosphatase)